MIQILDYSEKAIAVIGDTREVKEELKAHGGRFNFRLKCGAGWIFPKSKAETLATLLGVPGVDAMPEDMERPQAREEYAHKLTREELQQAGCNVANMSKWEQEHFNYYMLPCGCLYSAQRQKIKTTFWFGEHGFDYEEKQREAEYAQTNETNFMYQNLKDYDYLIELYTDEKGYNRHKMILQIIDNDGYKTASPTLDNDHLNRAYNEECGVKFIPLTEEDRQALINIWKQERAYKEKRVKTYLKRFGMSKVYASTFWADR